MVELGKVYLDASIVIRRTLDQPGALQGVDLSSAFSSELLIGELFRTLDRLRVGGMPADELAKLRVNADRNLDGVSLIPVDKVVLNRAGGPFPTLIKTLDAIHLATALLWADHAGDIVFLTHDRQLAITARACGLQVYPQLV
ncbi:conserved hypothetical protein [Candidatus Sulfopaludibacter sp. SbA4]|nr:conserved hypothetical protein [Candidatus Sulfopaludibacter sp. SbA4]